METSNRPSPLHFLAMAIAAGVGVALFARLIGLPLLSAAAPFWVSPPNDMATMMTGAHAILNAPWSWPLTVSHRLAAEPISVVYTDSLPWLLLTMKATRLGNILNPFGLYLLASYVLQPIAMALLLRALGVRRAGVILAGGLLALLYPAWLLRHGHVALTGHWIILLSLALCVASARMGLTRSRTVGFAALGALATGVHAYFLPPLGVCFGAALMAEVLQGRARALVNCGVAVLAMGAAVGLSAWVLGYGQGQGIAGGGDALGYFSMNIVAPLLPQGSAIFGQHFNGGWFDQTLDPNGGQWFEGYNYMGLGILLVLGAGLLLSVRKDWSEAAPGPWMRRYLPLSAGLAVLTLAAIGPIGYLGLHKVWDLPKPTGVFEWLGLFRCHGRFFWAAGYMLLAAALLQIDRHAKLGLAAGVLGASLLLQFVDTGEMRENVRNTFVAPAPNYHPAGLADAPTIRGRPWVFSPTFDCAADVIDRSEIQKLSLIALRSGGSSNGTNTARSRGGSCQRPAEVLATAAPGDRRITVAVGRDASLRDFARRSDCWRFLRGVICGADLGVVPGLRPASPADWAAGANVIDATIRFDQGRKPAELIDGWAAADPAGIWSDGLRSTMAIDVPPAAKGQDITLELEAMAFAIAPVQEQKVEVSVGGEMLATWYVERANWRLYRVKAPARLVPENGPLRLDFYIPDAPAPVAPETRRLGLGIKQLNIGH